jgi:hypothetical protein
MHMKIRTAGVALAGVLLPWALAAQGQSTFIPKPFPQPGQPPATAPAKATDPAPGPARPSAAQTSAPAQAIVGKPTEADLGVSIYPSSEYLDSFDAGRNQRAYLFGTNDTYADVIAFYKRLRGGGRELFKSPAMQQFDLDVKYKEETMAFPPAVIVKDYGSANGDGYLFVDGVREKRFKTIVEVVTPPR